ncbi:MAG: hypothetical protein JWM53_3403, partial [bacterium]|nr:hypothetical protein [bacterium]
MDGGAKRFSRLRRLADWLTCGDRWVGVAMLALVVYYVATRGVFQGKASGDGWFGFQYLRALVWFHTLDMQKPLPQFMPFFGVSGPGHHMPNRCPFGPVFVWMPFYLVGCALQGLAELTKLVPAGHGESQFETWVTALGTLGAVLVGWRYTYRLVERHAGRTAARIGSIAAVWATPIAWYAVTQPLYQHGVAFCFVAILVETWDRTLGDPSPRRMLTLGLVGGAGMMMREQEALWLLLPGVEALWHVVAGDPRHGRARWLMGGVVLTVAALAAFAPQMAVWWYYTGSPLHPAQVEPLRPTTPFIIVSLFSTRGGLFPWTPVAYASVVGLCFSRGTRPLALALLAVFALEVYVVSSAWVVTGGYSYGARRLSDGAVLMALGIGLLWARCEAGRWRWPRRLVAVFVALCVLLNVVAMELLRAKKIASSGAYARSAERFLADCGLPGVGRLFGALGYPFVQPAGWLFALVHHVPASTFEGVVGNWFLDRDGQWFQVQSRGIPLDDGARGYTISGLALGPPKTPARVTGPVRLLLPMFAAEPVVVRLVGHLAAGPRAAAWNGQPLVIFDDPKGARINVPVAVVRAGVNELTLTLPEGTTLDRLDFESTTDW